MSKKTRRKKRRLDRYWITYQTIGSKKGMIHKRGCGWARNGSYYEGEWVPRWYDVPEVNPVSNQPFPDCKLCGGVGYHMSYWITTKAKTIHKDTCQYANERNDGFWVNPRYSYGVRDIPYKDCSFCGGRGAPSNSKPGPKRGPRP